MRNYFCILAILLLICSCDNADKSIYPVAGNQYVYTNEDEVPVRTGTPDELDGKRLIVNKFSFTSATHASASFWTHDIYKTSDTSIWSTSNYRSEYYEYKQIGNDVFLHNDSCDCVIKSKKDCIIYHDTAFLLTQSVVIELGDTTATDEP